MATFSDLVGTGDPEGAVVASVGSLWHRTDGGAGTTLYVKESGTGDTGWIAVGRTAFIGCRAYKAAAQSVSTGTETALQFDTETFDVGALHDTATNNHRFGPAASSGLGGYYRAKCRLLPASSASGDYRSLYLKKGGTTYLDQDLVLPAPSFQTILYCETIVSLSEGEWVGAYFTHNAGSNLATVPDSYLTYFELEFLHA